MREATDLDRQILEAFGVTDYGDALGLVDDPRGYDSSELVRISTGHNWRTIPLEGLRYARGISSWASPTGFVRLLPAFLRAGLEHGEADIRDATMRDLTPRSEFAAERLHARVPLLDRDQVAVIVAWIDFVVEHEGHGQAAQAFWHDALRREQPG